MQQSCLAAAASAALAIGGCGTSTTLNGAGASFPAAIYQRWFQALASQGVRVNDQSVGSGAGVRQFLSRTVDFAASDVPMKAEEIAKLPQGVVQIPLTAGAIAVAYNHKGCDLKLSQVDGSIGYMEEAFVKAPLQAAAAANASGQQLRPTLATGQEGLAAIELGPDLTGSNPNPSKGYPIVTYTWVLLDKSGNGARLAPLQKVFTDALSDQAQAVAGQMGFISLPPAVQALDRAALATLKP